MVMLVTLGVIVLIVGAAGYVSYVVNRRQQRQNRIMKVVTQHAGAPASAAENRDRQAAKQRADIARKLKQASEQTAEKKKNKTSLSELIMQAGLETPLPRFWVYVAGFAVFVWLFFGVVLSWSGLTVFLLTFTAFFGVPRFFLKFKIGRRQKKFMEEFPDALDSSVRLLQAGMPIAEAVAMISREFTGPLREEMMRMYENQKIGVSLGNAALEMARRIPLTEVHMFATALQIQSETGSSLSEVLSNLSAVIRARFRLQRKIKALSSEAKASAAIIAALPILVSLGLYLVNRDYISVLFSTTKGNMMLGGAIFWMCCGVIIMRQMINFRV